MFNRKRNPKLVSATKVKALQGRAIDPKTVAEKEVVSIRNGFMLQQIHPWAASNRLQAQLACYAIAYLCDRLAEKMMLASITKNDKGEEVLPVEVETFVLELTKLSEIRLEEAQTGQFATGEVTFNEPTRCDLLIENNMPSFPEYTVGYGEERDMPYGRNITSGTVTAAFVEALNTAGLEIQGWANSLAINLAKFPVDVPSKYSELLDVLRQGYMYGAEDCSNKATGLLESLDKDNVDLVTLSDAYERAYQGYIDGALAYSALHCPAILGEEWVLE